MAIARVQFKVGGGDGNQGQPVATGNFGASCTAGNAILVVIRDGNTLAGVSVSDTLGTTYALDVSDDSQNPAVRIYSGILGSSGTNAVSVTGFSGGATNYVWVMAVEVSGLAASAIFDAGDAKTGTGVTDLVADAFSTGQAASYVIAGASQNAFAAYTAGTDFTLIDGTVPTNGNDFGGVQEYITSGILSSYVAHLTSSVSNQYTLCVAAYKGAAGGGGGGGPIRRSTLALLGVQ